MAKDPAFLFYASDFLTGTMFMSFDQRGKYIFLLCSQHQHGGFIEKNSFNSLVGDDKILRSKFIETEHGFYNVRLSEEMENRNKKSENISEAAKETWKKRKEEIQKNTIVLQSHKKPNRKVIRIEDEDEIENEIKIEDVNETELQKKLKQFFAFRKEIKKPVAESSKELLNKKLMKLSDSNEQKAIEILEQSIANGWQGIFELKINNNGKSDPTTAPRINGVRTDNKFTQALIRDAYIPNSKEGT